MSRLQRLATIGSALGLALALGACGTDQQATDGETPAEPTTPQETTTTPATAEGVTTIEDIYGPACGQVPTEGEGSAEGMIDDPVGTAASNNPLLTTLVQAVQAANLVDTLNDPNATYTVFAPANSAFEKLPPGTLDQLLANPDQLRTILTYHVLPQRYDAEGIAQVDQVNTVQGAPLSVSGDAGDLVIDEQEQATVLCGNIPTANATVFVIDTVMMPPAG